MTALLGSALPCQQWVNVSGPTDGSWMGGFDARRGRFVRFGVGNEALIWETAGQAWVSVPTGAPPFGAPAPRTNYGTAYDSQRSRLHLFGGRAQSTFGDMWVWDGIVWAQVPAAVGPQRRQSPAMAYDSARDRLVLFGGVDGNTTLDDTWEHDGLQWNRIAGATAAGTALPQMAFDQQGGRLVLLSANTLVWNGVSWAGLNSVATTATARLCYDEALQRVLLFSADGTSLLRELNGSTWGTVFQGAQPQMRATFYFDPRRNRSILASQDSIGDVWGWDGAQMARESVPLPHQRASHVWFDDPVRGTSVLFGGTGGFQLDETWTWDGHVWTELSPPNRPTPRTSMAATFDSTRGVGLVFGGTSTQGFLADLWSWSGANWSQAAASGPPPRVLSVMAFDSARGRAVLYGGIGITGLLNDTWEWNGAAWAQIATPVSPPASVASDMAFDPLRGRTVLFLGLTQPAQTWEWDGVQWQQITVAGGPTVSASTTMAFDPVVGKVVMGGAVTGFGLWEFDGAVWAQRQTTNDYDPGQTMRLIFSSGRQRLQLHNGRIVQELQDVAGTVVPFGNDCGSPRSVLMARARPTLGALDFALDASFQPGQTAFLGLSTSRANQPLGNGCTLLLGPLAALASAVTDAEGLASWSIPIPNAMVLRGLAVQAQAAAIAPAAPGGGVLTQGLELTIGD